MKKYERPAKHFAFSGSGFTVRYYFVTGNDELAMQNGEDNWLPVNSWEEANFALIELVCTDVPQCYSYALLQAGAFISSLSPVADYHFMDFEDTELSRNSIWVHKAACKKGHCKPGKVKRDSKSALIWNETTRDWR